MIRNTSSPKFKPAPLSTVRYWWGRLHFTRHFEIEVSVPPSAIIAQFYAFDTEPDTHPVLKPQTVSIVPLGKNGDHYTFELEQRRNSMKQGSMMPIYHTVAKANGVIRYNEGFDRTIVRGEVRAGQFFAFWMIVLPLVALGLVVSFLMTLFVLTLGLALGCLIASGFLYLELYTGTASLYRNVMQMITTASAVTDDQSPEMAQFLQETQRLVGGLDDN